MTKQDDIDKHSNLRKYWVGKFQKNCKKINSAGDASGGAETFMMKETEWVFLELGVDLAIECVKKVKSNETPFMSQPFLKYLKVHGGLNAVIIYLEFLCTECC